MKLFREETDLSTESYFASIPRPGLPERYHYTNTCQNSECGHVAYFDYYWNCKTKLYKHGSYWDYHRTSIWSAFDIHCPNCGLTLADK